VGERGEGAGRREAGYNKLWMNIRKENRKAFGARLKESWFGSDFRDRRGHRNGAGAGTVTSLQ
jgi:hypothetical protein